MSRPAVVFGGPSPEHDISILTGLLAARALTEAGRPAHALYWSKTGDWFEVELGLEAEDFLAGVPAKARSLRLVAGLGGGFFAAGGGFRRDRRLDVSVAINCCHGSPGEDGTLQAGLDLAGVPATGPTVAGAALGMDKLAFGAAVAAAGLPALPRAQVSASSGWSPGFAGPYIVKPRYGGSSIGIEVAADVAAVAGLMHNSVHLRAGAVVEPYHEGCEEVQVAIRTYPTVQLSNLLRPTRVANGGGFYGYREKYVAGEGMHAAQGEIDPKLADGMSEAIRAAATRVADLGDVRGVARMDVLVDGDEWWVNEINTIPGSLAKHLWIDPPVSMAQLLADMLDEALRRPTVDRWTTTGADGSALRSAGSIDGKLG